MAMIRPKGKAYRIAKKVIPGMSGQTKQPDYQSKQNQFSFSDVESRATKAMDRKPQRWKY